jgi:murein DD-endopeptidase MepM/ murein hydrolase activator NlpD
MRRTLLALIVSSAIMAADFELAAVVKQGEALRIVMRNGADGYTAEITGRKVSFFRQADGVWLGLAGVSALETPRRTTVTIRDAQGQVVHTAPLDVVNANYRIRNLQPTKTMSSLKPSPGEVERASQLLATVTPERHWSEPLHPPTGDCIGSPFGVQTWYNGKPSGAYHRGIDLYSGAGVPVKAVADGYVRIAQTWNMQGGMVGIDHGQGLISTYLHQSKLLVTEGQFVKRGETVGLVGSTGFSTGPHLHWGLAVSGVPVNGATWIASMKNCGGRPAAVTPRKKTKRQK